MAKLLTKEELDQLDIGAIIICTNSSSGKYMCIAFKYTKNMYWRGRGNKKDRSYAGGSTGYNANQLVIDGATLIDNDEHKSDAYTILGNRSKAGKTRPIGWTRFIPEEYLE